MARVMPATNSRMSIARRASKSHRLTEMKTQSGFVGTKRGCRRPMMHDRAAACRRVPSDPISKSFIVKFLAYARDPKPQRIARSRHRSAPVAGSSVNLRSYMTECHDTLIIGSTRLLEGRWVRLGALLLDLLRGRVALRRADRPLGLSPAGRSLPNAHTR